MADRIRVLVYPNWKRGSVYMNKLEEAVEENDIGLDYTSFHGAIFPLSKQYMKGYHSVLQIHWVSVLFAAEVRNPVKFWIRYILAYLDIWYVRNILSAKIVWTVHNLYSHDAIRKNLDLRARRFLAKQSDILLLHGPSAIPLVTEAYKVDKSKCVCIPHGNQKGAFPMEISKFDAREKLQIGQNKKVLLFFGTLRKYKGVEELIEAFKSIDDENLFLLIAGKCRDESYRKELMGMADDRTLITDSFVPIDEVQVYMAAADIVVLPFKEILTSGSLLLAMTFGKMIVAPRMGTLPDYLLPEGGILYDEKNENLKIALNRAMEMDTEKAGDFNKEKVDLFDWDRIGDSVADWYRKLIDSNNPHPKKKNWFQ